MQLRDQRRTEQSSANVMERILVGHCVRLVSLLSSFVLCCVAVRYMSPSSGLLCPPLACNPLHLSPSSGLLCLPLACNSYICLPARCCVHLGCCESFTFASHRWAAVSASALQSLNLHLSPSSALTAVSASALQSCTFVLAILCVCLPALFLLCPPLLCNPLSPSSGRRKL